MPDVAHDVPTELDSLFHQISQNFVQTEAEDVIHEVKSRYPTKQASFDQSDLHGTFKKLYELGAIDDGNQTLLEILAKKASKKDEISKLIHNYKATSSPPKQDFVGRDADMSDIMKFVTNPRVPGINLFGSSGVGKTTLAKKVSSKLKGKFEPFFIDLRGTKDANAVYFKVLLVLKLTAWDYSKERIYTHLRNLTSKTLLILDNVEQFVSNEKEVDQKIREEFCEFLRTMMSSDASKQGSLKVILTSRIQTGDSFKGFVDYELRPLTEKHSRQLMSWRLREETDEKEKKAMVEIADLCRNTPYLLEKAEQLLRQDFSKPSEVLKKLKNKEVPERFVCIDALFESLSNDEIKQVAVKISLLQHPFSVSTAMKITNISSDYDAEFDLEMLVAQKIITAEDVNGERKYDLHALFRDFVTSHLCKKEAYKEAYEKAENMLVEHFSKMFRQHATNVDKDFVGTYKELQEDKANFELSIDLVTRKEVFDLILQSDDVKETASVVMLFEAFKSIEGRRKLFGQWATIVEEKENWLSSTIFRCWESIQLADVEGTQRATETLKRAKMSLAKAKLMLPEQIRAADGLWRYCSGKIKYMSSANLIEESSANEKKQLLEQALSDLDQALTIHKEIYGDHTLTARTLNTIGNCHMERGEPKEALEFYQQAMAMKVKVVGNEKHFDIPTYYNNLSQAYEALGNEDTSWSFQSIANRIWSLFSKGPGRENCQKAVEFINKALSLQKELGVNDTNDTATFQRNHANILTGLGEYDEALKSAQKSLQIRKANLDKHPETVRILYLIGIIHEWRKDREAALQSYEEAFVIEESLPDDNHSVVRKMLCDRLEVMSRKLGRKDIQQEYKSRIAEIRKLTDARGGGKPDSDDETGKKTGIDAGERTSTIQLDKRGGYYDFSSDYFFLEVPYNAVNTPVNVRYKVDPCRCQPAMAGITKSISYFLEMSSDMTVELNKPITVTLMHSGPRIEYGYETTVMAFDQDKDEWEELRAVDLGQAPHVSNLREYKIDSVGVQINKLTILAVVTRLITDRFQVTPKGCVVRSSVCHDVTVEFPEGAVDKTLEGTMKLLLTTYGYSCPIILVDGFENVTLHKPVTITMPHPCPEEFSLERIKVMRLLNEPEKILENSWEDITDQIVHLEQIKKEQKCFIELQVQHFSWLWVSYLFEKVQCNFKNWVSSSPSYVRFGLFKAKDGRPVSMLKAFKVKLRCVDNADEYRHMKELQESYEELANVTSRKPMRPDDKALVKVKGNFEEKGPTSQKENPIIVFLGNQPFDAELNVCRKRREGGLTVSLYKEIDGGFLCNLSNGETEEMSCDDMYKMATPPRGYFVIINVNKFDLSTGLEERRGSDQDVQDLKSVFQDLLDFKMNTRCDDPKAQEILDFIGDVAKEDFSDYDCFGLCIMSHGSEDYFCGSDGKRITWSTIPGFFYKKPELKDKPKLFFFQACRNRTDNPDTKESSTRQITYLPSGVKDTLIVHSCFQGHESFRNENGTFFIQSFVRVLRENVNNEDMLSMITMVINELASKLENKQVPEMHSTLTKKLYLK